MGARLYNAARATGTTDFADTAYTSLLEGLTSEFQKTPSQPTSVSPVQNLFSESEYSAQI